MEIKELIVLKESILSAGKLTSVFSDASEVNLFDNVVFYRFSGSAVFKSAAEFIGEDGKRYKIELNGNDEIIKYEVLLRYYGEPLVSYSYRDGITMYLWRNLEGQPTLSCYANGKVEREMDDFIMMNDGGEELGRCKRGFFGFNNLSIYL